MWNQSSQRPQEGVLQQNSNSVINSGIPTESTAFSRLSSDRGSGRSSNSTHNAWDRTSRPGSGRANNSDRNSNASLSSPSSTPSLSPTSPMQPRVGRGLNPQHRVQAVPPSDLPLPLPVPGGGVIPMITSPEQESKRASFSMNKISFPTTSTRKHPGPLFQNFQTTAAAGGTGASQIPFQAGCNDIIKRESGKLTIFNSAHSTGKLKFDDTEQDFRADDMGDLGEIGRGNFGTVNKMIFKKGNKVMAVKRIRSTVDEREQKELLMDLEVVMKSSDCPCIVTFYGAIFKEGDCWICMELMDTSLDKFYKFIYETLRDSIPENIIGKITVETVMALNYLKERLRIIHRDVKPSNILLDRRGAIKLCDFGISGQLVDSIAKTRDAGCRPYMAPERIDPQRAKGYDVRSDVWSLGITLIELSTGRFPYPKWNSVFEQLQQVVHGDPPRLDPREKEMNRFTIDFVNFVNTCLIKDEQQRPKYTQLQKQPFIKKSESEQVDVAAYVCGVLDKLECYTDADTIMMEEANHS